MRITLAQFNKYLKNPSGFEIFIINNEIMTN